ACNGDARPTAEPSVDAPVAEAAPATDRSDDRAFEIDVIAAFEEPWAMAFLPDGQLLVTEKKGRLKLVDVESGATRDIAGVPEVDYGGQGGFGDVLAHPGFADNGIVYLSYAEAGDGDTRGAALARAKLVDSD